jgi:beta-lactam-binding protein with PASTA domain
VMGTATYFSPEQAQGLPVDPRSDLYSLGCVLYEMLTARPPFAGDSPVAIAYKHVQEQPYPPSSVNPSVPASLEAIDMKLLEKDPVNRYPSAEDLRADLRRFLEGQPVSALGAAGVGAAVGVAAATVADATQAVPAAAAPATGVPPYTAEEPPKKRTGLYVGLLVVLLLLVAGILFFIGRNLGTSTKQVVVPNVVGQSALDASNALTAAGFKVSSTNQQNDTVPEGQVFEQDPKGNAKADQGSTIQIIVSGGVGKVEVPNVVGRTQAAASSLLTNAGFVPEVIQEASDTIPSGQVISQDPAATTQQNKGSVVTIKVSSGVAQVTVPSVAGGDLASASATLGAAGFKVTSSQQSSTTVSAGTVINTNPAAGTQMAKGSTVNIIVSSGPPPTTTTAPSTTTTAHTSTTPSTA